MKRAKRLIAVVTAATMMFASSLIAFAEDSKAGTTAKVELVEPTIPAVPQTYPNLEVSEKNYYGNYGSHVGVFPEVSGATVWDKGITDFNKSVIDAIVKSYSAFVSSAVSNGYSKEDYWVSYKVENNGQVAKITMPVSYLGKNGAEDKITETIVLYYDKVAKAEVDKDKYDSIISAAKSYKEAYEKALKDKDAYDEALKKALAEAEAEEKEAETAEESKTEEAKAEEEVEIGMVFVPLRAFAEELGYKIVWISNDKPLEVVKDDVSVKFSVGVDKYEIDDEVFELGAAPTREEGVTYVPYTFFTEILGEEQAKEWVIALIKAEQKGEEAVPAEEKAEEVEEAVEQLEEEIEELEEELEA